MKNIITIAQTGFTILMITVLAFTACNKGKSSGNAADRFSIYGVWRHTGGADVEHGDTWTGDEQKTFSFFKDGENAIYSSKASENFAWQGVLSDNGNFSYSFNPQTEFNFKARTFNDFEVHGPSAWIVMRYDSENKRLVIADHTVEEYFEWAGESSGFDLSGFSAGTQTDAFHPDEQAPMPAIRIERATDELVSGFDIYHEFRDLGNLGEPFVLWTDTAVTDFSVVSVDYDYEGDGWFVSDILYTVDKWLPDTPILVNTYIGEGIPSRGIKFYDPAKAHFLESWHWNTYYYISESGVDGSFSLTEFKHR